MEKWIYAEEKTLFYVFVSTIVVFISIILLTRIFGKRSFSKMSSFDFACTIAVGSIIASTLLSKSVSLLQGLFALVLIFLLQIITASLRRFSFFCKIVDNKPLLLMKNKTILWENLKKANVTEDDIKAKLREANVIELNEVKAVVLETTGDISVLHSKQKDSIDAWIIEGVNTK